MEAWKKELYKNELYHHGILGMKWGIRRYQKKDGSLTKAGVQRYRDLSDAVEKTGKKSLSRQDRKEYKKLKWQRHADIASKEDKYLSELEETEKVKKARQEMKYADQKMQLTDYFSDMLGVPADNFLTKRSSNEDVVQRNRAIIDKGRKDVEARLRKEFGKDYDQYAKENEDRYEIFDEWLKETEKDKQLKEKAARQEQRRKSVQQESDSFREKRGDDFDSFDEQDEDFDGSRKEWERHLKELERESEERERKRKEEWGW